MTHAREVDISSGDVNWSHPHLGVQKEIAVTSIPKPHATMLRCLIGPVVLKSDGQVHQGVIHKVRKTCWSCCVSKTPVLKEIKHTLPEIEKFYGFCDSWIGLQFQEKSSTWFGIVFPRGTSSPRKFFGKTSKLPFPWSWEWTKILRKFDLVYTNLLYRMYIDR